MESAMPSNTVKAYAKDSGKSVAEVEKLWDECKERAMKKFDKEDEHYWTYISACTRKKLGLDKVVKESFLEKW
jgi:hypothetical protein